MKRRKIGTTISNYKQKRKPTTSNMTQRKKEVLKKIQTNQANTTRKTDKTTKTVVKPSLKKETYQKPSLRKKVIKNKTTAPWKLPGLLFLASLISIILLIPALIVILSGTGAQHSSASADKQVHEQQEITVEEDGDAISVAVMRSELEEVETVPLESYVEGVVASEMPVDKFELEALKAQALAARTYIVDHLLKNAEDGDSDSDVTDTVQHQVYKNKDERREQWGSDYEKNSQKLAQAVADTKGQILTYQDKPIFAAFFSTSNGYTENSEDYWENELPYLRSVTSPWDKESSKYLDQKTFTTQEVSNLLDIQLPDKTALAIETTRTPGNRVEQLTLNDASFAGRTIREKLDLQSSDFTIEQKGQHLIFTTKGYGHGIGMSQYGANGMAKEGQSYQDIVQHYYQDVEINSINETAPTLVSK